MLTEDGGRAVPTIRRHPGCAGPPAGRNRTTRDSSAPPAETPAGPATADCAAAPRRRRATSRARAAVPCRGDHRTSGPDLLRNAYRICAEVGVPQRVHVGARQSDRRPAPPPAWRPAAGGTASRGLIRRPPEPTRIAREPQMEVGHHGDYWNPQSSRRMSGDGWLVLPRPRSVDRLYALIHTFITPG